VVRIEVAEQAVLTSDAYANDGFRIGDLKSLSEFLHAVDPRSAPPELLFTLGALALLFGMRDFGGREPAWISYRAQKVLDGFELRISDREAKKQYDSGMAEIEEALFPHRGEPLEDQLNIAWEFVLATATRCGFTLGA